MRLFFLLIATMVGFMAISQTGQYHQDLETLKNILKKPYSYKRVKGESYESLYRSLMQDSVSDVNSFEYFQHLAQLVMPFRDNHMGFYQLPQFAAYRNQAAIDSFVQTPSFKNYPSVNLDLDSLKKALALKESSSVEGIYYYDTVYSMGIYKVNESEHIGVILESNVNRWLPGQVVAHLYNDGYYQYKAIYSHPATRHYTLQTTERYINQSLPGSYFYASLSDDYYRKRKSFVDHVTIPRSSPRFVFKQISPNVQYVRVGTFQGNSYSSNLSRKFYDSIKTVMNAPYLVFDLRDNEGGSKQEAKKYVKLIKKYAKRSRVYVLLNFGTLSQAELVTLKLHKKKGIITAGQRTMGMLAYGINGDTRKLLPSRKFVIVPTDMRTWFPYRQYEGTGIHPQISLNDDRDWIEQLQQYFIK